MSKSCWRRCRAIALVLEKELEKLAKFGIVLDDQDLAGATRPLNDPVIHVVPTPFRLRCRRCAASLNKTYPANLGDR